MPNNPYSHKQQLVHDAIYNTAIDLFAAHGFDKTTVEEVAQAAGVSRRTFFRYFASKDDLLAQSVMNYGNAIVTAITKCPKSHDHISVIKETVMETLKYIAQQRNTRKIIAISEHSMAATQAHLSRMVEVESKIAEAYAARIKGSQKQGLLPRLLAGLTMSIMSVSIMAWARNEYPDLFLAAQYSFQNLSRIFGTISNPTLSTAATPLQKTLRGNSSARKR